MQSVMLRSLSICGLLAVLLPAQAQDLSRKVTFSMPAARASVVLAALSKEAGISLTSTTKTGDEVLILQVKDVTVKDLMDRIAKVADAEWKPTNGGFELNRSGSMQNLVERAEREDRTQLIDAALRKSTGEMAKLASFSEADADRLATEQQKRMSEVMQRANDGGGAVARPPVRATETVDESPAARAIIAILGQIGASDLASIQDGERAVYATRANRMQRQLPGRTGAVLTDFIRQQQMLAAAARKFQTDDTRRIVISSSNMGEMGPGNPELGMGRAILTVQRVGLNARVDLLVADTNGQTLCYGQMMLLLWRIPLPPVSGMNIDDTVKISLSPLASEFADVVKKADGSGGGAGRPVRSMQMIVNGKMVSLSSGDNGAKPIPMSAELRNRILHPEQFDPLSLVPSEAVFAAAGARHENLVASLPDSIILPLTRVLSNGQSVDRLLLRALPGEGISIEERDGWMVAKPRTPALARTARISRTGLGKLLRTLDGQMTARLGDLTTFALAQSKTVGRFDYDGLALRLANASGGGDAVNALAQPDVLRFYASLAPAQRSSLESGGTISLANLSPAQAGHLSREVFQTQLGPVVKAPNQLRAIPGLVRDLSQERTEALPFGIPNAGTLQMKVEQQPAAIGMDATGSASIFTPDSLASRIFSSERSDVGLFGPASKLEKFIPAGQVSMSLHFEFPETVMMDRSLADSWADKAQNAVSYEGLPAEMKAKTDAALDYLRTNLGNVKFATPGSATRRTVPPASPY